MSLFASAGGGILFAMKLGEQDIKGVRNEFRFVLILELVATLLLWIVDDEFLKILSVSDLVLPYVK